MQKEKGKQMENIVSDEDLAGSAKAGDADALDALLRRFKNMVRSKAAMYFLSGGDRDDLIQEGMIGLYKSVRDYDMGKGSFAAFASVCVNRQIQSAVKASARRKHLPLNESLSLSRPEDGESIESLPSVRDNDPASLLAVRETYRDIGASLRECLSALEYDIFMRHIQGAGREEIASATGRAKKSVDNTLLRARRKAEKVIQGVMGSTCRS